MRFSEAIKKFISHREFETVSRTGKGYELTLRNFCLYMRNPMVMAITPDHIYEYFKLMRDLEWDHNSIFLKASIFRMFFKYMKLKDYPVLNYELIPHIKKDNSKLKRVATEEELSTVLEALKGSKRPEYIRQYAMTLMLADTGARLGEILSINVKDLEENSVTIKTEKAHKSLKPFRKIFWYEETQKALDAWLKVRKEMDTEDDALFVNVHVIAHEGQRCDTSSIGRWYRRFSKRIGLDRNFNCHSLRHKFGHDLNKAGASNSHISSLMGHADLASSYTYTMLKEVEMKEAHEKFKKKKLV